MSEDAANLESRLSDALRKYPRIMTAYSGGVDSTLVAVVARRTLGRDAAPAVIGDSASLPRNELDAARAIAADMDLELIEINPGEQNDSDYQRNDANRCYHCKTHLYEALHKIARERGFDFIANGTNTDDLGDHRPGLRAADEAQIVSPLLDAGFSKSDVRMLARQLGLPNADKPAAACLASRIEYGTAVTPERLTQIESAERALRELGFSGFRVRHHETAGQSHAAIARIELPPDQLARMTDDAMRQQIIARLTEAGYLYVTLDLAGFRSGSGNAVLNIESQKQRIK